MTILAQSSGGGDFLAGHMPEFKAMAERAMALTWNQTWYGQIIIGVVIAVVFSLINHAWGYARGFEHGRRRQQADSERFLQLASSDPERRLLPPASDG